ncbi:TolC family protein, partial [Candidatus Dependentiae bacterium]|nr:TolC family protein [Candidatus Dependentiae bacterium]
MNIMQRFFTTGAGSLAYLDSRTLSFSLCFLFLVMLLPGCHTSHLSFQAEKVELQRLAKGLVGEDSIYVEESCTGNRALLPQELSRDEAVRIALLHNRELRASLYELGIAKMTLADAVLFQNPIVSISAPSPLNSSPNSTVLTPAINYIEVETQILNIPDLIQIPLRRRMYSTQLEIALYIFVNKMIEIIAQTRQAYDKVLFNRALIENLEDMARMSIKEGDRKNSSTDIQKKTIPSEPLKEVAALGNEIA